MSTVPIRPNVTNDNGSFGQRNTSNETGADSLQRLTPLDQLANHQTALDKFKNQPAEIERLFEHRGSGDNHPLHAPPEPAPEPEPTPTPDPFGPPSDNQPSQPTPNPHPPANEPPTPNPHPPANEPPTPIPHPPANEPPTPNPHPPANEPPTPNPHPPVVTPPTLPPPPNNEPGAGSASPVLIGGLSLAALFRPLANLITSVFGSAPIGATAGLILYPNTAGGGRQEHSITGTDLTIQINSDQTVGQVFDANGQPLNISVTASGVDESGNPTGFSPTTQEDAEALSNLTGTQINVDDPIDTVVNNDSIDQGDQGDDVSHDAEFPTDPSQTEHIFGDRPGHMEDTPENREEILNAVNEENYVETNEYGNQVYHQVNDDGTQTWVHVREGVIQNAGVNAPGEHY